MQIINILFTFIKKRNMKTSNIFSLNFTDVGKGLIVAVIAPAIAIIQQSLSAGSMVFDWKVIGTTALAGGAAYLIKNFLTPAQVITKADVNSPVK